METSGSAKSRKVQDPTRTITDLLKKFINIPIDRIDDEITSTLKFLANHVGDVDRCALYLLAEGAKAISNTHEWVLNKKFSRIASQQNLPIDVSTFYTKFFLWGENLQGPAPELIPDVDSRDATSTNPPVSQLYIPITSKNKLIGAIGLSSFKKARFWTREETSFLALIGEVIVTAIDRKKMEAAVFASEKYYRSIMKSIPVGLLVFKLATDGQLHFVDANPASNKITDSYTQRILGQSVEQAFPFLKGTGLPEILKKVALEGSSWSSEGTEFKYNEKAYVYQIAAFQIAPNEVAVVFNDVTNKREMEKLLELENDKLKEIDKMREEFVAMTTHELKTPLVSLIGASEFLLRNYTSLGDEQILNLIEIAHRGSTRLKVLINDLLTVYRLESGHLVIDRKEIDLTEIVGRVLKDMAFIIQERQLEVVFSPPEKAIARVDPFKIEQVLINLVHNACKNTVPCGKITISVTPGDAGITVAVRDTGVGLTEEDKGKLFQKFTKITRQDVSESIDIQGTGLGLFISRQIVEAHGGKIWAESEGRNKGATFSFFIPNLK
jgi:signal transduction histidine kinase